MPLFIFFAQKAENNLWSSVLVFVNRIGNIHWFSISFSVQRHASLHHGVKKVQKISQDLVHFVLERKPHPSISTNTLFRLAELVLTLNSFEFNGQFFDQISGVAMGTKMGPSYACLFMGHFEHRVEREYTGHLPEFYKRYIDDGIGITTMERSELDLFINFVNSFHPSIKFTSQVSEISVNFLVITVTLHRDSLITTAYFKPTDSHSYLLYSSSHPKSCKDSIPFSQLLRLRRLCQSDDDFWDKALEMIDYFRCRSYPETVLSSALQRVKNITRADAFESRPSDNGDRTKLILTYHPHNLSAKKVFLKNRTILLADPDTHDIFSAPPLIVFRRDKNLRDILVRSHIRATPSHFGTKPCGRSRCKTCPFVIQTQQIPFPKGSFQIRDGFLCTSRNVVYTIVCTRCHMCYLGETGRRLADRCAEHLRNIAQDKQCPVSKHFNRSDHKGAADLTITAIVSCTNTPARVYLENKLINTYGTLTPAGINVVFSLNT